MRRVLRLFRNRWFLSALGFLAIALVIWLLGPFIAIADHRILASVTARGIATLLVLVIWLTVLLIGQWRARRKEKRLLSELAASDDAPEVAEERSGDALSEEQAILRERFEEAIALLRRPREGGRKKAVSLYELPWYLIIGPPGCGKTTALVHSGIEFPLAEPLDYQGLKGIGGTRNCDWWIADEAVLIDTAGRYTTQDSEATRDQAAWFGFLDLLKKYRRRRPINGVIVAFSLADLIQFDEATLEQHHRAIRKRLQELTERIGISIPVYLLFTKADLVVGFLEFFADLDQRERRQVWGTTFPLFREPPDYPARFAAEFERLLQRLSGRLNARLIAERDPNRRALILGFPAQFASLADRLRAFLQGVFQVSRFEQPIRLRGVYFSSGTQEGTPIDRLLGNLADAFGLDPRTALGPSARGKSYFITDLLRKVIFRERELAGSDSRAERLRAWLQRGAYALVVLVTVTFAIAWATSYGENKAFIRELESRLAQYQTQSAEPIASPLDDGAILPRLDALRAMEDQVETLTDDPPLRMNFGLYQGAGIREAVRDAYGRALNALLVPGLASRLEAQLAQAEDPSYQYELLKLYLMLVEPKHLDEELLSFWAQADWERRYPDQPHRQAQLQAHLRALLQLGIEPIEPNRRLVKAVREQLEQRPLAELVYGRLKLVPEVREAAPLTFEDIAGRHADRVFDLSVADPEALTIPALFTYRGFYQLFQPKSLGLIKRLRQEAWVYGAEESPVLADQFEGLEESVLDRYIDEYILRWDRLLGQLQIRGFGTVRDATEVVARLIRPDSPLKRVLDTLEANTDLTRLPKGTAPIAELGLEGLRRKNYYLSRLIGEAKREGALETIDFPPKRVKDHFALLRRLADGSSSTSLSIAQIQRMLTDLYSQLSAIEPESGFSENPFSSAASARPDIFHRLRTEAAKSPDPMRRWLRQIAANAQAVALGDAGARINALYRSNVLPLCTKLAKGRYPFHPRARREISVYDFGRLFGERGILNTFFKEQIGPYVDTSAHPWRWRKTAKQNLEVSDRSLAAFERAQAIRQAFFPEGGRLPSLRFSLVPRHLDPRAKAFRISFGGQTLAFDPLQPGPVDGVWPGPNVSSFLTMTVIDQEDEEYRERRDGQWAFYRLVNPSRLRPGIDRFRVTLRVQGFAHRFEVRAFSAINPFGLSDLKGFQCPEHL